MILPVMLAAVYYLRKNISFRVYTYALVYLLDNVFFAYICNTILLQHGWT